MSTLQILFLLTFTIVIVGCTGLNKKTQNALTKCAVEYISDPAVNVSMLLSKGYFIDNKGWPETTDMFMEYLKKEGLLINKKNLNLF